MIDALEKLLAAGKDSPEIRFGLGNAYLSAKQPREAAIHLRACIAQRSTYTAAWKLLGKALQQTGDTLQALDAFEQGITVAEVQGDVQAQKEMTIFRKRLAASLDDKTG